jgi:hypothetical protein
LTLYGTKMKVHLDTPSSVPNRTSCTIVPFQKESMSIPEAAAAPLMVNGENNKDAEQPAAKRAKVVVDDGNNNGASSSEPPPQDLMVEVENFASILSNTLDI